MGNRETKRCRINLLAESDFNEALPLLTDETVRRYLGGPISDESAYQRLKRWTDQPDSIYYTIRLKDSQTLIGLVDISPHHNAVEKEVSYQFLPEYWGQGYATEILQWILTHCREELQVSSVVSETQSANLRSRRLLERCGYTERERLIRFGKEQIIYVRDL